MGPPPTSRGATPSAPPSADRREPTPSAPPPVSPASKPRPCRLPEGAGPPPCPVVRRQRLARSSSPRRVREREAVTFGASPAQGTGPRAAPASSHSRSAPQGTRPKARPAGPPWGPRRAAGNSSRLTLVLVLLPPSKMAAPVPAMKKTLGRPRQASETFARCSSSRPAAPPALLRFCASPPGGRLQTGLGHLSVWPKYRPRLPEKGCGLAIELVAISERGGR